LLKNSSGEKVKTADVFANNDVVGVYFSAHWCPPCRGFTPVFAEKYRALKDAGKSVEVIFASSDKDEASFTDYYKDMPWLAMEFSERKLKQKLSEQCDVSGIPHLVFFDSKSLKTITANGRGAISSDSCVEDYPWYPKASYDLSESTDGFTGSNVFICFTDDQTTEKHKEVYKLVREIAEANKDGFITKWFTGSGKSGIEAQMKPSFGIQPH